MTHRAKIRVTLNINRRLNDGKKNTDDLQDIEVNFPVGIQYEAKDKR